MYQQIVILTGAGISAESGIRTFRDQTGLWEDHHIEDVATPEGYLRDPQRVDQFYNDRLKQLHQGDVHPNVAHLALAHLEREFAGELLIVTQNIDDLHERAGTQSLVHMHGELTKGRCPGTLQTFVMRTPLGPEHTCTCCIPSRRLRPHVVWFGELPFGLDKVQLALESCDLFISIGTSGVVYPAAGFVDTANHYGATTTDVNLVPATENNHFHHHFQGKAGHIVPLLVERILAGKRIDDES